MLLVESYSATNGRRGVGVGDGKGVAVEVAAGEGVGVSTSLVGVGSPLVEQAAATRAASPASSSPRLRRWLRTLGAQLQRSSVH